MTAPYEDRDVLLEDSRDFVARIAVEGGFCPDFWLELGWLGRRGRTMEEWMSSPAHEQEHGPLVFTFDDDRDFE